MADINQKINIKEVVDVSDALKGIKQIQDSLSHLKIGAEAKAGFDRLFSNIEHQAERANAALASGFKNKGDVTKYKDAMGQIVSNYDEIIRRVEVLKTKDIHLDVDVKKLETAKEDIKKFGDQLSNAQKEANKFLKSSSKALQNDIGKDRKGQDKWEKVLEAYQSGKISEATKALGTLKAAMTRAGKNGEDLNSEEWVKYAEDIQKIQIELDKYKGKIKEVGTAQQNFDSSLKTQNQIYDNARKALDGIGQAAIDDAKDVRDFAKATSESAQEAQQLSSELEQFRSKAAYFFGLSNAINLFKRAVRSAYDTVKDLDAVMTETAVVTNFDVGDMWSQLPEYTQRANELGVSIHSAYEAATIFYQQGLKTNEVMAISNETLKMARIAGLDAATASDRMTNALRGFNMEMDKMSAQRVNDVYSKLAAITASNTDEISTAMTKVASLAHNANMEFETTAAFLAQIIESTRESAETAGTALKTVVARFSEVKKLYSKGELLGQDEEGEEIDVNKVSTALRSAGINLNEYLIGAKGLDDIFIELAEKWDSLDQVQQRYIATMAAGSRQQSRFIALMSDYKRTVELVDAANNANGASQEQYGKTLESLQTKLARLKNAWDEFILGLTNSDVIKGAVDLLTLLITKINDLIKLVSGKNAGVKMITTFFAALTGFKVGQKIFGGTEIGKLFSGLTQAAGAQGEKGGLAFAKNFYTNLSNKIVAFGQNGGIGSALEKGIGNQIKGFSGDLLKYFNPTKSALINTSSNQQFFDSFFNNSEWNFNVPQGALDRFYDTVGKGLDEGTLTVDQLNTALRECGQTIQVTNKNAADFGITLEDENGLITANTGALRNMSAAAVVAGGALVALGSWMEGMEGPAKNWGTVIKGLGAGLLTLGTIMSVWLPLQAKLMAQGVSSAIYATPIIGWIAAIISAVIALGVAISGLIKNNSLETKLEKSQEAAKAAADAAEEAKEAYEELGKTWEELNDKYEAIENATKGTQEWRDAVKELNEAVLELMNTYEGVEVRRNADGILEVVNKEEIDNREKNRSITASAVANVSRINTLNQDQEMRNKGNQSGLMDYQQYKYLIDYITSQGILDKVAGMTEEESLNLIEDYFKKNGWDYGEVWSMRDQGARDLISYAKGTTQNQVSVSSERTALGADILDKANIDKDLQKYANIFLSDDYIDKVIEKNNEKVQELTGMNLKNAYAEARGYSDYTDYKSKNSEEEEISELEMRNYVLTDKVLKEASIQVQKFTNNIGNADSIVQTLFSEQEGGALTREQALNLQSQDWTKLYNDFGKYMFDTQDAFNEWLDSTLTASLDAFDTSQYGEEFNDNLWKFAISGLSSDTYKSYVEDLWSIYSTSGEGAMNRVQQSVKDMTRDMDAGQAEEFYKRITEINWASVDSIKSLDALADEFGISEDTIKAFENQIIELNNAVAQFDAEKLASALGLANKINSGEQGRSFSKEAYETAIANGVDSNKFVYNINTDAYDYIGKDIQDVRTAILQQTDTLRGSLEKQVGSNEAVEKLAESGKLVTNPDSYAQIRAFLTEYQGAAGNNSMISQDFLQTASEDQIRAKYEEIMQQYYQRTDTQAKLDQANAYRYQANTGAENAAYIQANNDELARSALVQQLVNSGLPEALIESLIQSINTVPVNAEETGNYANNPTIAAGNVVDTFSKAKEFGIDAETLNTYAESLRTVDNLENARIDTLYELALVNANYQEGFKNVIDSYDEWIELEREDGSLGADSGDLKQLETLSQLKKNLKQMFNLTKDVSDEFLEIPENVALLKAAVDGDTKAVAKLRAELMKTSAIDLNPTIDEKSKNEIFKLIDSLTEESLDLEFGASLDDSQYAKSLAQLLLDSGYTVDSINEMFNSIGWSPVVKMKAVPVTDATQYMTNGEVEVVDPITGQKTTVTANNVWQHSQNGMIYIPEIGNASFTPPDIPSFTPSTKDSGGGGGGSSKAEKPSYWENPYDELYNLQEKINESLRTREALERRYQKLLKQEQATLKDIRKSYYAQINQLGAEAELQKQFAAGRLRQIDKLGSELYTDSEGDRSSFSSWGVTKYASYDKDTGLIQIDWEGLEEISNDSDREEEGKAAEAYISKLEELVSSYEDVRDKLWDIEDTIEQLRQEAIDSYLSFEDRVMEALVNRYQKEIDSYQAMSDAIEKANNEVIDSLREQIDLSRQIRDNTQKEEDIADMENRLAYLQRDTSGANALEIQKLQKDIEQARENYTDTLVDQAIEKMQNDADLAAEQRAKQIETMQEQLDIMQETGALWHEVWEFINKAAEGDGALSPHSELIKLLEESEAFKSLSTIGQQKWWENAAEEFHKAWIGKDEAEDKYNVDANGDGVIASSGTSSAIESVSESSSSVSTPSTSEYDTEGHDDATIAGVAMNICGPNNGWGDGDTRRERLAEKGFNPGEVQAIVNDIVNSGWDDSYYRRKYDIDSLSDYSYYAFKTGGLADFTGPAWLDGTKTKPELVLNAQDTQNFIALKDILASLLNVQGFTNNAQKGGDNYFDIDINAQLEGDYDVDKLTEKIKRDIYNDGQYRNVNTLNYLR